MRAKGQHAQLQAQRQIINDHMEAAIVLRTNLNLINQAYVDLENLKKLQDSMILDLNKKVAELEAATQAPDPVCPELND